MILVPLDGSPVAEGILPYAEALSHDLGETLRLLYVAPQAPHPDQLSAPEAEQSLAATAAELRGRGASVTTTFLMGDPALQILAAAEESDVNLVLMATHGRGGLERWLIGSVADEVMRRCRRPTLLMVPSDFSPPSQAFKYHRLMVTLDGSPLAETALPLAIRLAQASAATILLVRALTSVVASLPPGSYVPDLGQWEQEQTAAAQSYLERLATSIPAMVEHETLVLRGLSPANSLVRFAQTAGVDLVVMSTHGYGGLQRLAIGSKADLMVRSAVPTLLVHPEPAQGTKSAAAGSSISQPLPVVRKESWETGMQGTVILLPLDGSAFADTAIPYAETLALASHRTVRLFAVVETVIDGLSPEHMKLSSTLNAARSRIADDHLRRIAGRLRQCGVVVEAETRLGAPAREILNASTRDDVAMVVMATGRGGADRWVMGSVADKVMRTATKPVLLVRPGESGTGPEGVVVRRLLVPLDGSLLAEGALGPATELALATNATLVVVRVMPYLRSLLDWGAESVPELTEVEAEMAETAQQSLEEVQGRLPAGLQSEAVVLRGPVARALDDYIQQHQIDLTVMTTRGRGGFSRFVLGSTANRLIQRGASVLLLHGEREEATEPEAAESRHSAATSGRS